MVYIAILFFFFIGGKLYSADHHILGIICFLAGTTVAYINEPISGEFLIIWEVLFGAAHISDKKRQKEQEEKALKEGVETEAQNKTAESVKMPKIKKLSEAPFGQLKFQQNWAILKSLAESIEKTSKLKAPLANILSEERKMIAYIKTHPEQESVLRRLTDIYQPKIKELIESYQDLDKVPELKEQQKMQVRIIKVLQELERLHELYYEKLYARELLSLEAELKTLELFIAEDMPLQEKDT